MSIENLFLAGLKLQSVQASRKRVLGSFKVLACVAFFQSFSLRAHKFDDVKRQRAITGRIWAHPFGSEACALQLYFNRCSVINFFPIPHAYLNSPDGAARIICFFTTIFPTTSNRGAGIRTHVSRVAPDWDFWRTLYRLTHGTIYCLSCCLDFLP